MFGRKKKKEAQEGFIEQQPVPEKKGKTDTADQETAPSKPKNKRRWKLLVFILLIVLSLAIAGFAVYHLYFSSHEKRYTKQELEHVKLPDEIFRFTFDHLPELYDIFIIYNHEIILVDKEMARLDSIAQEYPDQTKIIDKEKKGWEKSRTGGVKSFKKIKQKLETLFVSFKVNQEKGRNLLNDSKEEMISSAGQALEPIQTLTAKFKVKGPAPTGLIKGTLHKVTSKFTD